MREELRQALGLMHGGVMSSLIESVCSRATAVVVMPEGMVAMGQSINLSFLRPVTEGHAEVEAHARHRGRTSWVWEAEVRDAGGRLCALAQMTIAVRPLPQSA
jgi:1,4-dihydroxy-2-naphthoyl-CoA hydrolase